MRPMLGEFAAWLRAHRGVVTMAGVLAFAAPVRFFLGAVTVMRDPSAADVLFLTGWFVLFGLVLWALLLVVGFALQRVPVMRQHPRAATLVGALLAATVANLANGRGSILVEQGVVQTTQAMHAYAFGFVLIMALLFFAHLWRSRAAEDSAARLVAAQAAQHDARRRLGQARLQAMQARIDPQLLFDMLDAVRRAYEIDADRAERLLDELAAFLRTALSRVRSESSSVAREAQLAQATARLRALAGTGALAVRVDVADDVAGARFPPGVLSQLLDPGAGLGACVLVARRDAADCLLTLTLPARPRDAVVTQVGASLAELYGAAARLTVRGTKGVVNATIKVPYELAPD